MDFAHFFFFFPSKKKCFPMKLAKILRIELPLWGTPWGRKKSKKEERWPGWGQLCQAKNFSAELAEAL